VVLKRGFRVRVRVAIGGSDARNLRAIFFFSIEKSGLAALFQAPLDSRLYHSAAASVFGLAKLSERIERCFREETMSIDALRSFFRWCKG
jgi:uncharacterized membrane protein